MLTALVVAASTTSGILAATPAAAGGIGGFLSPAFGTNCANRNVVPHAAGATTAGTGAANGNLLGLPLGSPLNQCGGADVNPPGGLVSLALPMNVLSSVNRAAEQT
ncbi:hypothetical protein [Streptomyces sp. enrichment culture]|uniref:hypothetical protein n=1 Tax=Streptomyces sp. enrichment culture TaxID=1795815 RepID=UPI003F54FEB2